VTRKIQGCGVRGLRHGKTLRLFVRTVVIDAAAPTALAGQRELSIGTTVSEQG